MLFLLGGLLLVLFPVLIQLKKEEILVRDVTVDGLSVNTFSLAQSISL